MTQVNKLIGLVSCVGLGSWYAGVYFEQRKILGELRDTYGFDLERIRHLSTVPALPLFKTVSMATAFTPTRVPDTGISPGNRTREILKYGYPSFDNVRSFNDYVLSYDRRNRVPQWVFEHLTQEHITKNDQVDRGKCQFTVDEAIHPYFRSFNDDYKRSGYDRGHMAAAGNHRKCQKDVDDTFYLSNMAPQVGKGFNRDSWNRLEKHVRNLTKKSVNVYCCTGPLYLPKVHDGKKYVQYEVIGASNVAVPTHFFKIIVAESVSGQFDMEAYVMPNQVIDDKTPLASFQVPPESIERAAGLLFFDNLTKSKIASVNGRKN